MGNRNEILIKSWAVSWCGQGDQTAQEPSSVKFKNTQANIRKGIEDIVEHITDEGGVEMPHMGTK